VENLAAPQLSCSYPVNFLNLLATGSYLLANKKLTPKTGAFLFFPVRFLSLQDQLLVAGFQLLAIKGINSAVMRLALPAGKFPSKIPCSQESKPRSLAAA